MRQRRSLRLPDYDYSTPGVYFVTICTRDRICWLGEILNGETVLGSVGQVVNACWQRLETRFPSVALDVRVVMPNHVHGLIQLTDTALEAAPRATPKLAGSGASPDASPRPVLGQVVRAFKAASTRLIRQAGLREFAWQRNYYERIIRDEDGLRRARQYILDNPANWEEDALYEQRRAQ